MSPYSQTLGQRLTSRPYLANLASCLNYALSATTALFGGPIINKLGIRNACIIAGFCMCLTGTGFYVRAKYAVDGYLLAARVCSVYSLSWTRLT